MMWASKKDEGMNPSMKESIHRKSKYKSTFVSSRQGSCGHTETRVFFTERPRSHRSSCAWDRKALLARNTQYSVLNRTDWRTEWFMHQFTFWHEVLPWNLHWPNKISSVFSSSHHALGVIDSKRLPLAVDSCVTMHFLLCPCCCCLWNVRNTEDGWIGVSSVVDEISMRNYEWCNIQKIQRQKKELFCVVFPGSLFATYLPR